MNPSRWRRRALALWIGVFATWGAVVLAARVGLGQGFVPAFIVCTAIAVIVGTVGTVHHMRSEGEEPLITVRDLRRR